MAKRPGLSTSIKCPLGQKIEFERGIFQFSQNENFSFPENFLSNPYHESLYPIGINKQLDQFKNILKPSPVDCELGPWNECNATCGTGMQSRFIVQEALYGGNECSTNRTIECNLEPCPIDCELGPWSDCNATCGTGMQSRIIVQEALYGGKECSTNRTVECNSEPCSDKRHHPINCKWTPWSKCSTTCGPGKHYRKIEKPAQFGGKECTGDETQECSLKKCPTDSPIDCDWGPWSKCSVTCGSGMQTRTIVKQAQFGGKECNGNKKQRCGIKPCPIDCKLGPWTDCSVTCGSGVKQRLILQKAKYGGIECPSGSTSTSINCNSGSCDAPPKIYPLLNSGGVFLGVTNPLAGLG